MRDLNPRWILTVGIAGGIPDSDFTLGDVIVSTHVYDLTVSAEYEDGRKEYSLRGGAVPREVEAVVASLNARADFVENWNKTIGFKKPTVDMSVQKYYGSRDYRRSVRDTLNHHFVQQKRKLPIFRARPVVSGNVMVKDTEIVEMARQNARHFAAFQMEFAGVYEAARTLRKQYPVVTIRGISDIVGLVRKAEWTKYACHSAAAFSHALIKYDCIPLQQDHINEPALSGSAASVDRPAAAPSLTANRLKGDQLLAALQEADGASITSKLLAGEWILDDIDVALQDDASRAIKFVESIAIHGRDTWQRLIGAYVARTGSIPAEQILELGFRDNVQWGSRCFILSYLRFVPVPRRRAVAVQLMERFDKKDWDTQRLAIHGLGFTGDAGSISYLLQREGAYSSKYANEKLGPYGIMAFLRCYLSTTNDNDARGMLDYFVDITQATSKLGNLRLHFFDYHDQLQTMLPGKGVGLFRVLRDQHLEAPLSAVLAALCHRPNALLLDELIELGKTSDPVAPEGLHAAAYIGTVDAARRLQQLVNGGHTKARAGYILASGLAGWKDAVEDVVSAASDSNLPRNAAWTDDVWHNALWTAGELGYHDPVMAARVLEPLTGDPHDGYTRGLCSLGLAKSGRPFSPKRYQEIFDQATDFFERTLVSVAAAVAGWPDLLAPAIRGTIDNYGPIHRLVAHIERDLRVTLTKCGRGGADLVSLLDLGDFY